MADREARIVEEGGIARLIDDLAARVEAGTRPGASLILVGIRSRGVPIAERIAARIAERSGREVPVGVVDITLYRDDLGRGDRWPELRGTEIPYDVEGAEVVLVDDVLFTGRTVRAAIDCVCDLGRPSSIRLAVLVDRGGRELPIQADYIGLKQDVSASERVYVRLRPIDPADEVVRAAPASA